MPSPESGSTRPAASPTKACLRPRAAVVRRMAAGGRAVGERVGVGADVAPTAAGVRAATALGGPAADAVVGVALLREDPAVAAGHGAELDRRAPARFRQRPVALERDPVEDAAAEAESRAIRPLSAPIRGDDVAVHRLAADADVAQADPTVRPSTVTPSAEDRQLRPPARPGKRRAAAFGHRAGSARRWRRSASGSRAAPRTSGRRPRRPASRRRAAPSRHGR